MEEAGLPTLVLSSMPDVTASVGAPRLAAISHPLGIPLGPPGDAGRQRDVLRAALDAFESIDRPGGRVDLDFEGPPRSQRLHPPEAPPMEKLLRRRPWLLPRLMSGNVPEFT